MPYVPSKKTDGKSTDREENNVAVEALARYLADNIKSNLTIIPLYEETFLEIAGELKKALSGATTATTPAAQFAATVESVGRRYGYEGAFLGELNYSITRLIQRVPQILVEQKRWNEELRYWLNAAMFEGLLVAAIYTKSLKNGTSGVFLDVLLEYKRRVNVAYEAAQILKSGDCYDTPYYTRLVEVVDEDGNPVGHMEVMLKRSEETLAKDVLDGVIVLRKRKKA